jgi:hypothetical protein
VGQCGSTDIMLCFNRSPNASRFPRSIRFARRALERVAPFSHRRAHRHLPLRWAGAWWATRAAECTSSAEESGCHGYFIVPGRVVRRACVPVRNVGGLPVTKQITRSASPCSSPLRLRARAVWRVHRWAAHLPATEMAHKTRVPKSGLQALRNRFWHTLTVATFRCVARVRR